jgi:hypothetical protein
MTANWRRFVPADDGQPGQESCVASPYSAPLISVQSIFPLAISRFIVRNQTVLAPTSRTKLQETAKQQQRATKRALAPVPGGPNGTTYGAGAPAEPATRDMTIIRSCVSLYR